MHSAEVTLASTAQANVGVSLVSWTSNRHETLDASCNWIATMTGPKHPHAKLYQDYACTTEHLCQLILTDPLAPFIKYSRYLHAKRVGGDVQ